MLFRRINAHRDLLPCQRRDIAAFKVAKVAVGKSHQIRRHLGGRGMSCQDPFFGELARCLWAFLRFRLCFCRRAFLGSTKRRRIGFRNTSVGRTRLDDLRVGKGDRAFSRDKGDVECSLVRWLVKTGESPASSRRFELVSGSVSKSS
jgi:hypothetical protein